MSRFSARFCTIRPPFRDRLGRAFGPAVAGATVGFALFAGPLGLVIAGCGLAAGGWLTWQARAVGGPGNDPVGVTNTTVARYVSATGENPAALPSSVFLIDRRRAPRDASSAGAEDAMLRHIFGPASLISRLSPHRHAVALAPGAAAETAQLVSLARQVVAGAEDARIGVCAPAGAADIPGGDPITGAEIALKRALHEPPGAIRVTRRAGDDMAPRELRLAADLDRAFDSGQFVAFFQPQISTDTGMISGAEALARWRHPELGLLTPRDFLPTVEAEGMIPRLTDHMVRSVLLQLAEWDAAGLDLPCVSINFTQTDLSDRGLPTRLAWMLEAAGLGPGRLGIEVLESVLSLARGDAIPEVLADLSALGCRIDLDDFGTGQSSINALRRFSVDRIKIDRSFVRGLDRDPDQQSMVAAIVTLAEQLKLEVVAEGIEAAGEHSRAAQLGCRHVQGFWVARPMQGQAVPGWLLRQSHKALRTPVPAALRRLPAGRSDRPGLARRL